MLNSVLAIIDTTSGDFASHIYDMVDRMKNRGSVGQSYVGEGVGLGNSISDYTGKYLISFDGTLPQITNPAETILEAYKIHGTKCLDLFDGSFSFCLWDSEKKKLLVARDRYGRRPLYYSSDSSNQLILASQIDALWTLKKRKPNFDMICNFLITGTNYHNGETFYEDVKEFLPGQFAFFSTESTCFTQERFSKYPKASTDIHREKNNSKNEFSSILFDTIQRLTPSNGIYATSISGGLDSTIIASILSRTDEMGAHKLYSGVCDEASYTEAEKPYMVEFERFVQKEINYVKIPFPPSWTQLQEFISSIFEPTDGINAFMFWSIAKAAKQDNVASIFFGTSADTFLLGLEFEQKEYLISLWKRKKIFTFALELLGMLVKQDYSSGVIKRALSRLNDEVINFLQKYDSKQFINFSFLENHYKPSKMWFDWNSIIAIDNMQILDRMFASNGVEPIHPFLNKKLVEYLADLPLNQKIKYGTKKYILREVAKGLIPEAIRKTKRKFPSSVPRSRWLVELQPYIMDILDSKEFKERGFYNVKKIKNQYEKLIGGKLSPTHAYDFTNQLWRIINVEFWFKQNFVT